MLEKWSEIFENVKVVEVCSEIVITLMKNYFKKTQTHKLVI